MTRTSLIALTVALALAQVARAEGIEYSPEWGANLCAGETGATVVEVSSTATPQETLLDGSAEEGHHWEPAWARGLPAFFTIKLARVERFNKLVFTTKSAGKGWPRECELWTGPTLSELRLDRTFAMPKQEQQVAEFESVEARFVRVVVKSTYRDEELEIGEVAMFHHGSAPPRPSDTKDAVELKVGDRLLGELQDVQWTLATQFGPLKVERKDLFAATLQEEGDRVYLSTGEIVIGELATGKVKIRLDSGQLVELAREKVAQVATRRGSTDFPTRPEDLLQRGAVISFADGERWIGKLGVPALVVQSAVGKLSIPIDALVVVEFGQGGQPLDRIVLRNGDVLRGLAVDEELPLKLALGLEAKVQKSSIARIAFAAESDPALSGAPENQRVQLKTGDTLSGAFKDDKLRLKTSYATIDVSVDSLDRLDVVDQGKLKAVLRDGSFVVGRPEPSTITFVLEGGGEARLPIERIQAIENWRIPSDAVAKIEGLIKKLDDPSWPAREAAKQELTKLGKVVIPRITKVLRGGSPEAKTAAQEIMKEIREALAPPKVERERE